MKMKNDKLYFEDIDATLCEPLEGFLNDARLEGLKEITLVEAIPDNDNPDYIWCTHYGECIERSICRKAECDHYESKSGRGKCNHLGILYQHGEEVKFIIE